MGLLEKYKLSVNKIYGAVQSDVVEVLPTAVDPNSNIFDLIASLFGSGGGGGVFFRDDSSWGFAKREESESFGTIASASVSLEMTLDFLFV